MIMFHHVLWNYFQTLTMIPVNLLLIYSMIYRRKDWSQYETREKFTSNWTPFNHFDLNPYKKRPEVDAINEGIQKKQETKKPYLEEDVLDRWYRLFLAICQVYYTLDTLIKFYDLRFPTDYLDLCKMAFLGHHLVTCYCFKGIFWTDHYPWFL